jgi:acylphosphatase
MLQSVTIIIEGLVQGVFFRQSTKAKALESGVTGQVRNQRDGSVHITATGTEEQLQELIQWCYKGPERAVVKQVKVEPIPYKAFKSFNIIRG